MCVSRMDSSEGLTGIARNHSIGEVVIRAVGVLADRNMRSRTFENRRKFFRETMRLFRVGMALTVAQLMNMSGISSGSQSRAFRSTASRERTRQLLGDFASVFQIGKLPTGLKIRSSTEFHGRHSSPIRGATSKEQQNYKPLNIADISISFTASST